MGGKIYVPGSIQGFRPEIDAEITTSGLDRPPGSSPIRAGRLQKRGGSRKSRHPGRNRPRERLASKIPYKKSEIPYNPAGIRRRNARSAARSGSGGHFDRLGVLDEAAPFGVTDVLDAVLLGDLLEEELGAAVRALAGERLLPEREFAVRIAVARPEGLAAVGLLLDDLPLAALGAGDARGDRRRGLGAGLADVLALRVAGAPVEGAEAAALERHRLAAQLAGGGLLLGRRRAVRPRGGRGLVDVAAVLAVRIVAAGDERPEAAEAHHQAGAVVGALLVERDAVVLAV